MNADGFAALDVELARTLGALSGETRQEVLLSIAVASERTREGHVCVRLEELEQRVRAAATGELTSGPLRQLLSSCELVGSGAVESPPTPLVLSQERLYLSRFYQHELAVFERLSRLAQPAPIAPGTGRLRDCLKRWFSFEAAAPQPAVAAASLALRRLLILTGGPGTGKTTTIARLLAFFADLARGGKPPRMLLLAPTGKAAARMGEAVATLSGELKQIDAVAAALPSEAFTIHRALGPTATPARFAHGPTRPLLADIVVVDEASMVDIALMRRLLDALSPEARLVLVGDEHQLASVEAGAVLADACAGASHQGWSVEHRDAVRESFDLALPGEPVPQATRVSDCVVHLTRSYRFDPDRGVGRLARAIVEGDADTALAVLRDSDTPEAGIVEEGPDESYFDAAVLKGFRPFCEAQEPKLRMRALTRFRVLCAHRRGPRGVETLNGRIANLLQERRLLVPGAGRTHLYYPGRPLLITKNDAATRLFNGDIGVIETTQAGLRAAFAAEDGLRYIPPARLPEHESVYAMSIHKSQGSEVDSALVVMPEADSPLCTRELLYTAVTRVKRRVAVLGDEAAVRAAIERRVSRASGLARRLSSRTRAEPV